MPMKLSEAHHEYMNIGKAYWGADTENFTPKQKKAIAGYLSDLPGMIRSGIGIYLWGDNSRGKSYIAAALCRKVWADYRVTSYYVTASELKEAWIDDVEAHPGSSEMMTDRVQEARFLVLDDFGKEHRTSSGFAESKFGALLRSRKKELLTTVITSNLDPREFGEVYGPSTKHLMRECMVPIRLKGQDIRERIAKRIYDVFQATA